MSVDTAAAIASDYYQENMNRRVNARERLIVALDLPDVETASAMVEELHEFTDFFKVGLSLQLASGVEGLIQSLLDDRKKLFLDYKYYDIPETLTKAVSRAASRGVTFLTVHGSSDLIKAAVKGRGETDMKLFTVTVLTSWDESDLKEMGYTNHTIEDIVLFRAKMALNAGCDGVIASGHEAEAIKKLSKKLLVVTPGIRPYGHAVDDQKRRMAPRDAILAGADYLVIGRPITEVPDPVYAAASILAEMQEAFDELHSAQ
jgi:orotidine-5'-phosphate decarboxylase